MRKSKPAITKVFALFLALLFGAASVGASARLGIADLGAASSSVPIGKVDAALAYEAEWALCEAPSGAGDSPDPVPLSLSSFTTGLHSARAELPPSPRAPPREASCQTPPATGPPSA